MQKIPHATIGSETAHMSVGETGYGAASDNLERHEGFLHFPTVTLTRDEIIEADAEGEPAVHLIKARDYTGTVVALDDLTHDVKRVRLALEDGPIDFQAGRHVKLVRPGIGGSCPFSIANAPSDGAHIELQIRRTPGSAGAAYIHETLKLGDRLSLSDPFGRFLVQALAKASPNFFYVPALSQEPETSDWRGERGFVHEVAKRVYGGGMFAGATAYLCGPPLMIEACIATLTQGGLSENDIFAERFPTSKVGAEEAKSPLVERL